ncbi:MAG: Ig-like domain-containing protein [Oceanobacter sp.]
MNESALATNNTAEYPVIQLLPGQVIEAQAGFLYQLYLSDTSDLILRRKGADLLAEIDGEQIALVENFYELDGEGGFLTPDGELIPFAAVELPSDQLAAESVLVWESDESSAYSWLTLIASGLGSATGVALLASGGESGSDSSSSDSSSESDSDSGVTHTLSSTTASDTTVTLDETAPTASIELSSSSVNAGETVTVTFVFSEAVTDFSNEDVVLESGSLSEVTSSDGGLTWTATYIPASNTDDANALISLTGDFTDLAGNAAATSDYDGETLAAQASLVVDTTRPTATLSVSEDTLQVGDTAILTIVFNEAVTDFTVDDISAANATVTDLTSTDGGISWTATLTAMEGFESATNQVRIGTDYSDLSGNKPATSYGSNNYLVDTAGPVVNSGNQVSVEEDSGANQIVYTADVSDMSTVSYELSGSDSDLFGIDTATGEITLLENPDYETRSTYNISLIVTDAYDNQTTQAIVVQVTPLDEIAPVITSADTTTLDENSALGTLVYTATSTDNLDTAVTYSLSGTDAASFTIDASTGEVTVASTLDHESQSSYEFILTATDAAGNSSSQTVTVTLNDLDESAPVITSDNSLSLDEGTGAGDVIYRFTATDTADVDDDTDTSSALVYSLTGDDADLFSFVEETGELTLLADADYETQSSYTLELTATDEAGNSNSQTLTISVNDLDETADDSTDETADDSTDETSEDTSDGTADGSDTEESDTDECDSDDEGGHHHGHHHEEHHDGGCLVAEEESSDWLTWCRDQTDDSTTTGSSDSSLLWETIAEFDYESPRSSSREGSHSSRGSYSGHDSVSDYVGAYLEHWETSDSGHHWG